MPADHLIATPADSTHARVLAELQRRLLPADAWDITEYLTRKPDGSRDLPAEEAIREDVALALERIADAGEATRISRNRTTFYMLAAQ